MATRVKDKKAAAERWRVGLSDDQLKDVLHKLKLCRYFDERCTGRAACLAPSIPAGARRGRTSAWCTHCTTRTRCSRRIGTCRRS